MPIDQLDMLKVRVSSLKTILERASEKQKGGPAGRPLAENFNKILQEVEIAFPDLKPALPAPITSRGPFADMGASDATYLEVEIFAEQVLSLLALVRKGSGT